jgi:hypothetical protein
VSFKDSMVKFGSIFRHSENSYVYLGQTEDIIYAARILDAEHTGQLSRLSELRARTPEHKSNQGTIFCFVILSTAELNGRAAYLHDTGTDTDLTIDLYMELCQQDIDRLKEKILEDAGLPSRLREIVRESLS